MDVIWHHDEFINEQTEICCRQRQMLAAECRPYITGTRGDVDIAPYITIEDLVDSFKSANFMKRP
jgi:hypothetical protein